MEEKKENPTPPNNSTTEKPIQDNNKSPKTKKKWLIILIVVLSVLLVGIGGYIIYTEFLQKSDENTATENENSEEQTEDKSEETSNTCEVGDEECLDEETSDSSTDGEEYTTFNGEVLTAQLPDGWSIIEYFNGNGTESLPDMGMDYHGLTALDIVSPDTRQVFTLQAVSGIGFIGCPSYAIFDDDNISYRYQQESLSDDLGEELNTIDYTDTSYEEFDWLGVTFRRIGEKYYYDTQEGNNYFEPPCVDGLLTLEGLYFTDDDETIYESYFYGPTEDATEEDLPIVDQILESMELI